jgi:hypothetical protein
MNCNLPPGVSDKDIDPHRRGIATVEIRIRVCVVADNDGDAIDDAVESIDFPCNANIVRAEVFDWDFE